MAMIIDGRAVAREIQKQIKEEIDGLKRRWGMAPGLGVVLVGDDPASHLYVRNKEKMCKDVGIRSEEHLLPASVSERELLSLIHNLNRNKEIHGILVQLPLPAHIRSNKVLDAVLPQKDVKNAVVVGRSNIVGKPVAVMLLERHATVTVCHSRTAQLKDEVGRGDILVVAIGKAGLVRGDWIKPGAVVIDVGSNRLPSGKFVGDVEFESAKDKASWISPVPGGVGPMTICMLLFNTLRAAKESLQRES
ncbi:MAG: bifunctional 5,10-methylenetetrahydrofolate dehydrogenase/5,10-methenyltetrahydrofolate cyclohydrolase [Deltaproteobacteria bacterium]|nr:bifunctional 5,10-methylenetetrahydrofolate dehydrogenase/5,10-methenyltetrahydrofolate cyclohydrolase [Deltaproteobacteria bacterium]